MEFYALIGRVATLFLLLMAGFVARRTHVIDDAASKRLSQLIICIGQPFMIISALLHVEYSKENLKSGLIVLVVAFLAHILMSVIAFLSAMKCKDIDVRKVMEFTMIFSNCGFMGFPVLEAVLGPTGLFYGAFYVIAFNVFTWTWGLAILGRGRPDIPINPKKILLNYGTLPSIIGIVLYVCRLPLPQPVIEAVDYLGGLCTPISMLITGALIATQTPRTLFCDKHVYFASAIRLIVMPCVVGAVAFLCRMDQTMMLFLILITALPSASNAVMMTERYDIRPQLSARIVAISTLLSTATIPAVLAVVQWLIPRK